MAKRIDPNHVYISYQGDNQGVVDKLCGLLREKGIAYCTFQEERGKIGRIHDFEKKIGRARMKVIFYSKKYFESPHCMNEYAEIREHDDCDQYVRMVNCDNVKFTRDFVMNLEKKWGDIEVELKYKVGKLKNEENAAREHRFYKEESDKYCVQKLEHYFRGDPNYDNCSDSDLEKLVSDIKDDIDAHPIQSQNNGLPKLNFATRRKELIVPRDKEADEIYNLFFEKKEAIVNMVGWGGCGKSTISEYFVHKYGGRFAMITGVTVNTDFYEDICYQFRDVLKEVPYELSKNVNKFGEPITYVETIAKLDKYPIVNDRYNLIIIDINETASVHSGGYSRIKEALKHIENTQRLSNWKILVIAREKLVEDIPVINLVVEADKVDLNILKGIFKMYLGAYKCSYYEEPEFKENDLIQLFEKLDNCILLVEQLARFLRSVDRMSYEDIVNFLEIDGNITFQSFMSNLDIKSLTDQDIRNEKVVYFLSRLISFKDLDENSECDLLKRIVRLFAVWERSYYSADAVICFLVDKRYCDTHKIKRLEYAVHNGLGQLVDKRIFDTRIEDGKTKYQIHGLIAEACRRQIFADKKFIDFSDYTKIIDSNVVRDNILKNKCIIYSLANFVSLDEKWLLKKAQQYHCCSIYERALKIKFLRIKSSSRISDMEIYLKFETSIFKNQLVDSLYYEWLDKESGYVDDVKKYSRIGNNFIDNFVEDMVFVKHGRYVIEKEYGFFQRFMMRIFQIRPKRTKVVHRDFYIGATPVTQGLWKAVMGVKNNPSYFKKGDDYPVEMVSWYDCLTFIMELNHLTKLKFRLPTEVQWEFAARGGRHSKGYKYSGSNRIGKVAWCDEDYYKGSTHPVKQKVANELGIYDMSGNVWEWCQDFYIEKSQIKSEESNFGKYRVLRGGSWYYAAACSKVSNHDEDYPTSRDNDVGFRIVISPHN